MKKKLLTLLTLLVIFVTGAWAQTASDTYLDLSWTDADNHDVSYTLDQAGWSKTTPAYFWDATTKTLIVSAYNAYQSVSKQKWITVNVKGGSSSGSWTVPTGSIFKGDSYYGTTNNYATTNTKDPREYKFSVKSITEVQALVSGGSSGRVVTLTANDGTTSTSASTTTTDDEVIKIENLDPSKTYTISILNNNNSNSKFYEIAFIGYVAPAAPTITTQPQSASYMTGQTIEALTVVAEGTGTLTYQWYSCDDAEKTNAAEISGATSASYTPTAAGFYYVTVTDSNGSVDSDVAEITVSSATAPTITVSGAPTDAVKIGTEITLTATVTGVPTPTIQWYSCDDVAMTNSSPVSGAIHETYSPGTDYTGTICYYAIATNSQGSATSAVQTITVKEQVATPTFDPNGAYFQDSQEVTLACTTAGATIKYSTDDGATWTDYTAALTFDATTTVQAKAIKDGYIDSEVATATFNKITLVEQTSINGATTWDWTKFGTKEIKTEGTAIYRTEVLVANVPQYGFAAAAEAFGPADALILKGDYIVRDTKYCQVTHAKFNTTVPGTIEVVFSNTGGSRPYRYLYVNGVNTGFKSNASNSNTTATGIIVGVGDVDLYGILDPDAATNFDGYNASSHGVAGEENFIRIYSIKFTPITNVSATISPTGWSTYCSPVALDFTSVSDLEAYIATGVEGTTVTTSPLEGTVPANTPLLLKGIAEAEYTIPVVASSTTDVTANKLVAGTGAAVAKEDGVTRYVLSANEGKAVFKMIDTTPATVPVGKAYLEIEISGNPPAPMLSFYGDGETTGIRPIDNGQLIMDNVIYDLSGRRVENPTKGVYIMNGKKVLVK